LDARFRRLDLPRRVDPATVEEAPAELATAPFSDTRLEAEQIQLALLRQAPSWRKLEMLGQLNQTARTLALSGLQQRYPQATPEELHRRLADLLLGQSLAAQVYGPLTVPEVEYKASTSPGCTTRTNSSLKSFGLRVTR